MRYLTPSFPTEDWVSYNTSQSTMSIYRYESGIQNPLHKDLRKRASICCEVQLGGTDESMGRHCIPQDVYDGNDYLSYLFCWKLARN